VQAKRSLPRIIKLLLTYVGDGIDYLRYLREERKPTEPSQIELDEQLAELRMMIHDMEHESPGKGKRSNGKINIRLN